MLATAVTALLVVVLLLFLVATVGIIWDWWEGRHFRRQMDANMARASELLKQASQHLAVGEQTDTLRDSIDERVN